MNKRSCLIIAGEKSGEEHALTFLNRLKLESPDTHFFGVGGDELKKEGVELLFHLNDFSSWGYSEVLFKIPFYFKAMNKIVEEVKLRDCKTAILIDFQSFNLKLAGKLKELGVDVLYYVAPQAWAWKEYRVKKLASSVHTLFTIIPFEKKWFKDRGVERVIGIDHPLWTAYSKEVNQFDRKDELKSPIKIVLLPGSRKFEVEALLPIFIESINFLKKELDIQVSIVKSSSVPEVLYGPYAKDINKFYTNESLITALKEADFSFASSGTVTLTCALFGLPTIVCYKTSLLNQFIYETLVSYRWFISLANIVQNRSVFPELLQDSVSSYNIVSHFNFWYYNKNEYFELLEKLRSTKNLVRGDVLDIPKYMAEVLEKPYGKQKVCNN